VLFPITTYICEILEENNRETNLMDLCYEDLVPPPPFSLSQQAFLPSHENL